jgi:hypothetical protein
MATQPAKPNSNSKQGQTPAGGKPVSGQKPGQNATQNPLKK